MTGRFAPGNGTGTVTVTDVIMVWRALFGKFSPLIGPLSTELLFARALATHESAFPWLPQAAPGAGRSILADFEHSLHGRAPDEIVAVNRALLLSYTTGLSTLIGDRLTTRFLQAAFPGDDTNNKQIEE